MVPVAAVYDLDSIVDGRRYRLDSPALRAACRATLARDGALLLPQFLTLQALATLRREAAASRRLAYFCTQRHNVFLLPPDPALAAQHPRNREVASTKGCITDDQVPAGSALRRLYDAPAFRRFLCAVLKERALHAYADPLSSINVHYTQAGQELGWHFDNSSFAITLLIEAPEHGGTFEYVSAVRDAVRGEMNFAGVQRVLDGDAPVQTLRIEPGTLVLFRGRDALHRVTPVTGARTRVLAVLAYNTEPGIALSASARLTFYGRLA